MVLTNENNYPDSLFSLHNIWPSKVRNVQGSIYPFNPNRMVKSINKETGLDWKDSIDVVKGTLKRIARLDLEIIETTMVRELICVELSAHGFARERNIYGKLINRSVVKFTIDENFIKKYSKTQPSWGPLGYITYKRTYARIVENEKRTEEFFETVRRVVEGVFSIQKEHSHKIGLPWDDKEAQQMAQKMYDKIWNFKFTPPGRGFWMMGTEFIDKHGSMALNNCGFCSTADINIKKTKAFEFLMDALMLGVGVGFDTKGAGKIIIKQPKEETFLFEIPDSREGWVQALRHLISSFFDGEAMPVYDFRKIRSAGEAIRGFGGVASGPEPLKDMLDDIKEILQNRIGQPITSLDIVDIMNLIGKCVVAGNVRRSAEIALGDLDDQDYIRCKDPSLFKEELMHHRWASNNSVIAKVGMDYKDIIPRIVKNGEPGLIYLENAQKYSRMIEKPDYKDKNVVGVNPCITGDTLIAVADGRDAVEIETLAREGKDVPVYCKNEDGITEIRMMRNPRKTGIKKQIYRVCLDDGSYVECTGDHKFLLRDKTFIEAKNLKNGDSLMLMAKWQTTWDEIMENKDGSKKNEYWMVNTGKENKFEHTMVYEQLNQERIPKGYVLHHKDKNSLNNGLNNLELLSKTDHDELHDISRDNNPMRKWFPQLSEEKKKEYKENMSISTSGLFNGKSSSLTNDEIYKHMLKCIELKKYPLTIPEWKRYAKKHNLIYIFNAFRGKLINLIKKANIESGYGHYDNPAIMREYKKFIILLDETDLELEFNDGIWIIRHCEVCDKEFKVKWSKREQSYCSNSCVREKIRQQPNAQLELGKLRRKQAKEKIFKLFDKYVYEKKKVPNKSEFIEYLNKNGINDFRTGGIYKGYPFILDNVSERYGCEEINSRRLQKLSDQELYAKILINHGLIFNHKIISIQKLGFEDVYNGTVDEFHNYGIVLNKVETASHRPKYEIIFTRNCGEQSLESFELCCLAETFPSRHDSYEEYEETLEYAYLYAKSVTMVNTHWDVTNAVMLKNRRMGISQTGIIDAIAKHGRRNMMGWCKKGYKFLKETDEKYSNKFCIPKSIKITTVKPSGTVSLLAGVSPGIHYPHAEHYIRRVRISKDSTLVDILKKANYPIEDDKYSANSIVVEFPIHRKNFLRGKNEATLWEQIGNAIDYQKYWSDNQVSITVTFSKNEIKDLEFALQFAEDKIKGISLLPLSEHGYEQAPYEEISKEEYEKRINEVKPITLWTTDEKGEGEVFCDGDSCKCEEI